MVYGLEMAVKIVALSFRGYWLDKWNRLDFVINAVSLLGVIFRGSDAKIFRTLRLLRALRPLRLVGKAKSMQLMLDSVVSSAYAVLNVELLLLFIVGMFAVRHCHFTVLSPPFHRPFTALSPPCSDHRDERLRRDVLRLLDRPGRRDRVGP